MKRHIRNFRFYFYCEISQAKGVGSGLAPLRVAWLHMKAAAVWPAGGAARLSGFCEEEEEEATEGQARSQGRWSRREQGWGGEELSSIGEGQGSSRG